MPISDFKISFICFNIFIAYNFDENKIHNIVRNRIGSKMGHLKKKQSTRRDMQKSM